MIGLKETSKIKPNIFYALDQDQPSTGWKINTHSAKEVLIVPKVHIFIVSACYSCQKIISSMPSNCYCHKLNLPFFIHSKKTRRNFLFLFC